LQSLLPTYVSLAGFGLLVLRAVVVVEGRVNIGFSEDVTGLPVTGLPARLIGLGLTVIGFVLLVGLSPALFR
jgi:hypothetical protein